jgi:hypothetical protein
VANARTGQHGFDHQKDPASHQQRPHPPRDPGNARDEAEIDGLVPDHRLHRTGKQRKREQNAATTDSTPALETVSVLRSRHYQRAR